MNGLDKLYQITIGRAISFLFIFGILNSCQHYKIRAARMDNRTYLTEVHEIHAIRESKDSISGLITKNYYLKDSSLIKTEVYDRQKLEHIYLYHKKGKLKRHENRQYYMKPNPPRTKFEYYPYSIKRTVTDYYGRNGKPLFRRTLPEEVVMINGSNQYVSIFRDYNSRGQLVPIRDTVVHEIVMQ